jgi:hypothetical protein
MTQSNHHGLVSMKTAIHLSVIVLGVGFAGAASAQDWAGGASSSAPSTSAPPAASPKTLAFNGQGTFTSHVPTAGSANSDVPGSPGGMFVRGNNSALGDLEVATRQQQTGAFGGGN